MDTFNTDEEVNRIAQFVLEMNELEKKTEFASLRNELFQVSRRAIKTSKDNGGKFVKNDRQFWASVIMTRIAVSATTAKNLYPSFDKKAHWDFSAFANIARSIMENYLIYYWLCIEDLNKDEWELRRVSLYIFDFKSRWRMAHGDEPVDEDDAVFADLMERFQRVIERVELSKADKQRILRARGMPFVQDDVLDKIGLEKKNFRSIYRFLSEHVHSGPVSFYRMAEHGRGTGVANEVDRDFFLAMTPMLIWTVNRACDEMIALFEKA